MIISRLSVKPVFTFLSASLFSLLLMPCGASSATAGLTDAPILINAVATGSVKKNVDPDGDNLLEVGGRLTVTIPNPDGAMLFTPSVNFGRYGVLRINSVGGWHYAVNNEFPVIQKLASNQSLTDTITVSGVGGTGQIVVVTIIGADDETTNTPAVISGVDSVSVNNNIDPDGDGLLEVGGKLTVTDPDSGEAFFKPSVSLGNYGFFYINSWGDWHYAADNTVAAIQNLAGNQSLTETTTVSSADGTTHNVIVTIRGVSQAGGISVAWRAPVERENGSPISMAEIAGYRVYYGKSRGNYTNEVDINGSSVMEVTLSNLTSGTYYIVVTTVDSNGRESAFSQEVIRTL